MTQGLSSKASLCTPPWLSGWGKRIKLTSDSTKIDADLTWFPITVFLKAGNGDTQKVFDEVGANKYKIAIADDSSPPVEYYVEIERWDAVNKVGILHFGKTGEVLPSTTNKDFYLYYDNTHADNTTYVGVEGETPAQNVWEAAAKGVWHMNDNPDASHIKDSTSNLNNGMKKAANEPQEVDGKIGKAENYDGTNDYISVPSSSSLPYGSSARTVMFWVYTLAGSWGANVHTPFEYGANATRQAFGVDMHTYPQIEVYTWADDILVDTGAPQEGWFHIIVTYDGNVTLKAYINGVPKGTKTLGGVLNTATSNINIGRSSFINKCYLGKIDEVRIYNKALSDAEIKATYHSTNDSLLSYGTEEENPTKIRNLQSNANLWKPEEWLTDWSKRRAITITAGANGMPANFQVKIVFDTATEISQGDMQSGGQDIRFTKADGETLIPYWIEGGINTANTIIWVKDPDALTANSSHTIYLYYGNPNATAASNGENVFDFFDGFGALDTNKWNIVGDSVTVENGIAKLGQSGTASNLLLSKTYQFGTGNGIVEWRGKTAKTSGDGEASAFIKCASNSQRDVNVLFHSFTGDSSWGHAIDIDTLAPWPDAGSGNSLPYNTWKCFKAVIVGRSYTFIRYSDNWGTEEASLSFTDNQDRSGYVGIRSYQSRNHWCDWFRIRKYVDPEPTKSIGAEEEVLRIQGLSSKASIKGSFSQILQSKANLWKSNLSDLQSKANVVKTIFADLESEGNVVLSVQKVLQTKSNLVFLQFSELSSKTSLFRTEFKGLSSKTNILPFEWSEWSEIWSLKVVTQKNLQSKANIRIELKRRNLESKASIARPQKRDLKSQANVIAEIRQELKSKANLWRRTFVLLQNKANTITIKIRSLTTRGSISKITYQNLRSKVCLSRTEFKDLDSKANTVIPKQQDLSSKANITIVRSRDLDSKAWLFAVRQRDLISEASIKKKIFQSIKSKAWLGIPIHQTILTKANVVRIYSRPLGSQGNILVSSQQNLESKAYIFIRIHKVLQSKAFIWAVLYQNLQSKASIWRAYQQNLLSEAGIVRTEFKNLGNKANIFVLQRGILSSRAWLSIFQQKDLCSKASLKKIIHRNIESKANLAVSTQRLISIKANIQASVQQNLKSKGHLRTINQKDLATQGNVWTRILASIQTKTNIWLSYRKNLQSKGQILIRNSQVISSKASIQVPGEFWIQLPFEILMREHSPAIILKGLPFDIMMEEIPFDIMMEEIPLEITR